VIESAVRERDADLPVIAISGAPPALLEFTISYGASCVFSKPFDASELLQAVQGLMRPPEA
jgi:CheY-like chemotaxis protein